MKIMKKSFVQKLARKLGYVPVETYENHLLNSLVELKTASGIIEDDIRFLNIYLSDSEGAKLPIRSLEYLIESMNKTASSIEKEMKQL